MSEWTDYRIAFSASPNVPVPCGQILEKVYHVVHVPTACRILEDNCLKAGLIYDESKLRKSRIAVTWLSANTWGAGSIYGNVQFSFPWSDQADDRRFYWVEVMTTYRPHAYRILLTDRDLSQSKNVREYDPSSDKGPLRERGGVWYWNASYTSEFMIEGNIGLENCTDIDFIGHHSEICRLDGPACKDRNAPVYRVAGRVLAAILGHEKHSIDHVLKRPSVFDNSRDLSEKVDSGIDGIIRALGGKKERFGGAIKSEPSRMAVMRGALALYGSGQLNAARALIALLKSEDIFETALTEVVNDHFKTTGWTIAEDL